MNHRVEDYFFARKGSRNGRSNYQTTAGDIVFYFVGDGVVMFTKFGQNQNNYVLLRSDEVRLSSVNTFFVVCFSFVQSYLENSSFDFFNPAPDHYYATSRKRHVGKNSFSFF